jgi:hypothetical protein
MWSAPNDPPAKCIACLSCGSTLEAEVKNCRPADKHVWQMFVGKMGAFRECKICRQRDYSLVDW